MTDEQRNDAQMKLQAYHAALQACSAAKSYSNMSMNPSAPTVTEIKNEAERLWAWMTGEDKKPA